MPQTHVEKPLGKIRIIKYWTSNIWLRQSASRLDRKIINFNQIFGLSKFASSANPRYSAARERWPSLNKKEHSLSLDEKINFYFLISRALACSSILIYSCTAFLARPPIPTMLTPPTESTFIRHTRIGTPQSLGRIGQLVCTKKLRRREQKWNWARPPTRRLWSWTMTIRGCSRFPSRKWKSMKLLGSIC